MKLIETVGATSRSHDIFIADSSSTTGAGLTGLVYNSAGLTAYWNVPGTAPAAIALATLAANNSAWSSGGFKEIDATNRPGWYRFDIPDAVFAAGRSVSLHLKGATNMAPLPIEFQLTTFDLQSARVDVGKWLGTAVTLSAGVPDVNIKTITDAVLTAAKFAAGAFDAVWTVAARVLTAGTNIVLAKGTGITGFNDIAAGSAMTLTAGERTAIANEVEAQIIDETDSEKVLTAITDKIASVNPSLGGLTLAAIASAVRDQAYAGASAGSIGAALSSLAARLPGAGTIATTADVPSAATVAAAAAAQVTTDHGAGSYIRNTEPPTVAAIAAQITTDHGAGSYLRNTEPDPAATIVAAIFARAFGANFQNKTFAQLQEAMAATLFGPTSGAGTAEEVFHDLTGGVKVTVDNNSADRTATTLA